tara:strand:+ start:403 stop:930 length:528 start_codon:yes stop_codon:yes gene_type:complete
MESIIVYSSTDGHTKKICEVIKNNLKHKESINITPLNEAFRIDLNKYDQIIIGASIRYGKHSSNIYKFIKVNKDILEKKKSAFFSVNVVARKPEKNTPQTNPYIKKFLKKTNWKPNKIGVFAGKIDYPNLNFLNKNIIRLIMYMTSGPTDIKNSYEFTNWQNVKSFAKEFDDLEI